MNSNTGFRARNPGEFIQHPAKLSSWTGRRPSPKSDWRRPSLSGGSREERCRSAEQYDEQVHHDHGFPQTQRGGRDPDRPSPSTYSPSKVYAGPAGVT